jgi:hypothetical protein
MSRNEHKAGPVPNRRAGETPKNRQATIVANGKSFARWGPVHP